VGDAEGVEVKQRKVPRTWSRRDIDKCSRKEKWRQVLENFRFQSKGTNLDDNDLSLFLYEIFSKAGGVVNTQKEIILITGGSGHIASALIDRLASSYDIIGLDAKHAPAAPAHCVPIDLESDASVEQALQQVRQQYGSHIASVLHLAAYYSFTGEPDPRYYTVNVLGTQRLLRALQSFEVGQFVFSSSILVHAPRDPGHPINEEAPLEPKWDYPQSKAEAEEVIRREHGHIPFAILRIAGVYEDDCRLPALAQQIQRVYERKLIGRVFPGNSGHGQASVHLDDLVEAFSALIERRASLPRELTLLIGEPETPSYAQIQHELGRLIHGQPGELREIPKVLAKTGAWLEEAALPKDEEPFIKPWMIDLADDHYELDISRAASLLGWAPKHRLLATLPEMIYSLKSNPVLWYKLNRLDPPADLEQRMPPRQAPACETRSQPRG
jgi:nucleoside-diphosphate-sugar epimerase